MLSEITQKDLSSAEVRDQIIKEFAEEIIRIYPDIVSSMEEAIEALGEAIKSFITELEHFVAAFSETCNNINYQIQNYPNRRVVHLALHGKTERIRKKNLRRIFEYFEI